MSDRRGAEGGLTRKRQTELPKSATAAHPMQRSADPTNPWPRPRSHRHRRGGHARNTINEDNRLIQSTTGDNVVTDYRYDAQGTRRAKYSRVYGETLYADRMYQEHVGTNPTAAVTKHIFVGQTRIASKLHYTDQSPGTRALYMTQNTFWYHPDHLGSTNWVTDHQGEGYEHFTYTPYGEVWVEEHLSSKIYRMTHRFTGQELDPETGLYAFPARNYDPRTSRWLSADPALEEYLPIAPTSDEAQEHNRNLPGIGGVFNTLNLAVYHYGANNPLKYVDPDGREVVFINGGGPRGENPTAMNGYIRAFWGTSNRQDYGRLTFPVFDHLGGPLNNRVNPENVGFLNGSFGDQNPDGIVGWSMGADTAAQFLLQTEKSDFGFIVLDGGLPLSTDEIRNIANKTDSLTIIFHENDLLGKRDYGNLGAKALQEYVDLASELDNFSFIGVPGGHHPAPEAAFPPVKDIE